MREDSIEKVLVGGFILLKLIVVTLYAMEAYRIYNLQ